MTDPNPTFAPLSPVETPSSRKKTAAVRWAVVVGLVFMTGLGMVLLFLLTLATRNRVFYEQNFAWLVGINVAVAAVAGSALADVTVPVLLT